MYINFIDFDLLLLVFQGVMQHWVMPFTVKRISAFKGSLYRQLLN